MDWTRINELREEIGEEDLADVLALFLEEDLKTPVNVVNATGGRGVTGHRAGL